MKIFKKFFSIVLSIVTIISVIPLTVNAATSGTCGDGLTWEFLPTNGVLRISGTGSMDKYFAYEIPWWNYIKYIKSIVIGEGVIKISDSVFGNHYNLINFTVDSNNQNYSSDAYGVLFNKDKTTLVQYPIGNEREQYTIPNGVTIIDTSAFECCYHVENVTIPNSVTTINDKAFNGCHNLLSVTIPYSINSIGDYAFGNCENLLNLTVDFNNLYYSSDEYGVLFNKDKTTLIQYPLGNIRGKYTIPDSVTAIGDCAFYDCRNLTSITILDGVTMIGEGAFGWCTSLTSITIPNSVTTIGDDAFAFCTGVTSVTLSDNLTMINNGLFSGCENLTSVIIPNSVTIIGDDSFFSCKSLASVIISDNVDIIGESAFGYCTSITNVTIPNSVTLIDYCAFFECTSLVSIIIGYGVTRIADSAFSGCKKLEDVYYMGSEEEWKTISIGQYQNNNASLFHATIHFNSCEHRYSILVTLPTCTISGYSTYTCSLCGDTYVDNYVNATGHNYTSTVTAPTCTAQGYTTYTCDCDDNYVDNYVNATGHADNDGDGYCDACGEFLNPSVECYHNCHKDGISGFFWKIANFFNKLFKTKQYCECGIAHY